MARRAAAFSQADYTRAAKAAAAVGYAVKIGPDAITLVPSSAEAQNSATAESGGEAQGSNPWDAVCQ